MMAYGREMVQLTTPHINPVLLHTMPSDNILVTILNILTFLPPQMEQVILSLITYLGTHIFVG